MFVIFFSPTTGRSRLARVLFTTKNQCGWLSWLRRMSKQPLQELVDCMQLPGWLSISYALPTTLPRLLEWPHQQRWQELAPTRGLSEPDQGLSPPGSHLRPRGLASNPYDRRALSLRVHQCPLGGPRRRHHWTELPLSPAGYKCMKLQLELMIYSRPLQVLSSACQATHELKRTPSYLMVCHAP